MCVYVCCVCIPRNGSHLSLLFCGRSVPYCSQCKLYPSNGGGAHSMVRYGFSRIRCLLLCRGFVLPAPCHGDAMSILLDAFSFPRCFRVSGLGACMCMHVFLWCQRFYPSRKNASSCPFWHHVLQHICVLFFSKKKKTGGASDWALD